MPRTRTPAARSTRRVQRVEAAVAGLAIGFDDGDADFSLYDILRRLLPRLRGGEDARARRRDGRGSRRGPPPRPPTVTKTARVPVGRRGQLGRERGVLC